MTAPALRPDGDEPSSAHVQWTDLNFHRAPDMFLPLVSPRAWKVLCGILVDVWSQSRHITKTNKRLMRDTALGRSALLAGMRELETRGLITCIEDPDLDGRRIIQLNWTLKLKWEKGDRFAGTIVEPPPIRKSEPPPFGNPNPPAPGLPKNLDIPVRESEPHPFGNPNGAARNPEPPPVLDSEPPSYLRDSKDGEEREQQDGPASSSCPAEEGTPTPALVGGKDREPLDERLWPSQEARIRKSVSLCTGKPSPDLLDKLRRHEESTKRLGRLAEPDHLPATAALARMFTIKKNSRPSG